VTDLATIAVKNGIAISVRGIEKRRGAKNGIEETR
jgi:hypothetical protein